MATHSSILAWEIPWTGESGRLKFMESQRLRHSLVTKQQQHHAVQLLKHFQIRGIQKQPCSTIIKGTDKVCNSYVDGGKSCSRKIPCLGILGTRKQSLCLIILSKLKLVNYEFKFVLCTWTLHVPMCSGKERRQRKTKRDTDKEFQTPHQAIQNGTFLDFFNYLMSFNPLLTHCHSQGLILP